MEKDCWVNIEIGDKVAYSEAYVFYYKKLYNYGRKFTNDLHLIEDAIDEVFIMIWTHRQNISKIKSPQSYIFSSFRNQVFKSLKEHRTQQLDKVVDKPEIEFFIDNILIKKETDANLQHRIQAALQQLTNRQKEAIFLRFYEGLTYNEVAEIMNISIKATYKIVARALQGLKEILSMSNFLLMFTIKHMAAAKDFY